MDVFFRQGVTSRWTGLTQTLEMSEIMAEVLHGTHET